MFERDQFTIRDVGSLEERQKEALLEYCRAAFEDEAVRKQKGERKSITLASENGTLYKLVAEREKKSKAKTVEQMITELGLSEPASKKIVKEFKARDLKRYHITDIKYLSDLIQLMEPAQQKKAIDLVIQNRKNFYQVNKEELVLFVLAGGHTSAYNVDLWYSGALRTLEKLDRKLDIGGEALALVDPEQKKQLAKAYNRVARRYTAIKDRF